MLGLLQLIAAFKSASLISQYSWLVLTALAYLSLGWLFGSYTVLRWQRLPLRASP